jgi:hypothetical protein
MIWRRHAREAGYTAASAYDVVSAAATVMLRTFRSRHV